MPFPLVDVADPKVATRIAYNWHMGPVLPDDFSLTPWSANGYSAGLLNPRKIVSSGDTGNAFEEFDFLRYTHRSDADPRPTREPNAHNAEWKALCIQWTLTTPGGTSR